MKQKLRNVGTFAFALMASIPNAKADTTILNSDNGYQKITTMPESLSDYYFIIVDRDKDLMLSLQNGVNQGNKTMFYRTSVDPTEDLNKVWELEAFDGGYSIRNIDYDVLLLQTEWNKAYHLRTNDQPVGISWAKWLFSYDTDSWTIENGVYPMSSDAFYKGYVGSWKGGDINDGDEVAGNKSGDDIGHYCIYSIKKGDFHNLYVQKHKTQLPISMTSFIFNEAFEANGQDSRGWGLGWQGTGTDKGKSFARQTSNQANFSGAFAEMYGNLTENNLSQTIKGLPAGVYRLSAAALNNTNANAQLYAKAGETELASLIVNKAPAQIKKLEFTITEMTDVTIGFSVPETSSTTWIAIDNFTLEYVGADESEKLENEIKITKETAQGLYSSPMEKSVLDVLKAKVADAESASTIEDKKTCLKALNTAIATANTSIAAYETLKTAIDKANEIVNSVYIYKEEDKTIYTNAIAEAQAAYTNGTYTDAQAAEIQKQLWNTEHQSGTLLARPFISSVWSGGVYTNNWSVEADNKANGSGMTTPFIEYWTGDTNSLGANEIKAELSGIEAGFYKIEALVRVRIKNNSTETPHGITMQANGASTTDVCNGKTCDDGPQFRYDVYSTVCEVKEDGTLAIVFNVAEENNISWLSFKEVKYMETTAKVEDIAVKVSAEYGTMILPFDAEIPSDMEVYSVSSCSEQTEEYSVLSLQPVTDKITANIPYIVKSDATDFTFNGIILSKENTSKGWLTGVMTDTPAPLGSYVLQKQDKLGLGFYLVETDDIIVPAHRAYLTIPETSAANVRAFVFDLGNATGINHVEAADALVNVYSIDGVLVRKAVKASEALNGLRKGVYVVNGVKKAVK